jgi:acetolactate synthase I/II/III large subunit
MKTTDYIAEFLVEQGVDCIFEVAGGMIAHLIDSVHRNGKIRLISVHHEQAGAFAADAVGRITGIPGVAMATSGPGAINLLSGIASCYFDSSPAVFLTGQVNRNEQTGDRPIRQLGFQETDIVSMAAPITKAAWKLQQIEELPNLLSKAFAIAKAGRPGPVLLDLPMDLQREHLPSSAIRHLDPAFGTRIDPETTQIESSLEALRKARRPLVLIGGGIRSARAAVALRALVDRIRIPVVHSLMAVDVLPFSHPLRIGMIGTYGNRWANMALGNCDCLMVLGSRLDIRQTGSDTASFRSGRRIIHVDCEAGEINNRIPGCDAIVSTLPEFLALGLEIAGTMSFPEQSEWLGEITRWRARWPDIAESRMEGINPNVFMHQLSRASTRASAFVADVGQHQMWAAQSLELNENQRFLSSGGLGSMGFGLPAAIGACLSQRSPVVVISGDGGFQCNLQELQTVVTNKLPIKMVVVNNRCHGMVRQFQESYFESRYQSTLWGYEAPDFERIACAYGIASRTIAAAEQVPSALECVWHDPLQSILLQVMVDTYANAYPKISFGQPVTGMEPSIG